MRRYPAIAATVAGVAASITACLATIGAAVGIALLTHSGLGPCSFYGPAIDLVLTMLFGSVPIGFGAGVWAGLRTNRLLKKPTL